MLCYLCFKVENYDILLPFNKVSFLVLQDLSSADKKNRLMKCQPIPCLIRLKDILKISISFATSVYKEEKYSKK